MKTWQIVFLTVYCFSLLIIIFYFFAANEKYENILKKINSSQCFKIEENYFIECKMWDAVPRENFYQTKTFINISK